MQAVRMSRKASITARQTAYGECKLHTIWEASVRTSFVLLQGVFDISGLARNRKILRECARVATSLIVALLVMSDAAIADTQNDFDTAGTPYGIGHCVQPPKLFPAIVPGGPTGNFVRIAGATAPDAGTIAFDKTDPGAVPGVVSQFDLRITPKNGRADGAAWALLNTTAYGSTGPVCPDLFPWAVEWAPFRHSVGVGFDIYRNQELGDLSNNHIKITYNGVRLYQIDAAPIDLANGQWIHVKIILRMGNDLSDITVVLSPPAPAGWKQFGPYSIPGLAAYEGRVLLGARSGGESSESDVDNVETVFLNQPSALPAMVTGFAQGMSVQTITCRNLTTAQTVTFSGSISWDCVEHGLSAHIGDRLKVTYSGVSTQTTPARTPVSAIPPVPAN